MRKNIKILTILFYLSFSLCSCCMTYRVYLSNNSSKPRNIKVTMTDLWSFNSTDSVYISESLSLNRQIPVSKNKQDTSFSFVLDSGRNVLVQGRAGVLDLSENIIIDDVDTLRLKNINRFLKEKRATGHKRWWGRDFIIKAEE